jgi:hypothetical protein
MKRMVVLTPLGVFECSPSPEAQKLSLEELAEEVTKVITKLEYMYVELMDGSFLGFGKEVIGKSLFRYVDDGS